MADIYKKVEEGKNLMLTSNRTLNKLLGQSDTLLLTLASNTFLQLATDAFLVVLTLHHLWVAVTAGVILLTDIMNLAQKRFSQCYQFAISSYFSHHYAHLATTQ